MADQALEADYVIIGAGAVAMAFADTLLSDSDTSLAIVDRRHKPGGHWNDAYPFVRLHGPAANYGVNSRPLGSNRIDEVGLNKGLYELATGPEICAYFDQVMHQRLLPSGRVTYLPMSDYGPDGVVTSRLDASRRTVRARRKVVDGTFAETRLPSTHPPAFRVGAGVRCIPPNDLPKIAEPAAGFTVVGAGKTAMDSVVWLLEQGVDPDAITWIRPRDAWLMNRSTVQPSYDFFNQTVGAFADAFESARDAGSIDDLFLRLEVCGQLRRIDRAVTPTMFRCAIVSDIELEMLRQVRNVVRRGHVTAIEPDRIVLEDGEVPTTPAHVHVHCSADGIPRKTPQPIFQPDRIVLQYVRWCSPAFSGAFVAHLEATLGDDAQKNRLCTPTPVPDAPADWLRMRLQDAANQRAWGENPDIQAWMVGARLDLFSAMMARAVQEGAPERLAILERYRLAVRPGLARLGELLAA